MIRISSSDISSSGSSGSGSGGCSGNVSSSGRYNGCVNVSTIISSYGKGDGS